MELHTANSKKNNGLNKERKNDMYTAVKWRSNVSENGFIQEQCSGCILGEGLFCCYIFGCIMLSSFVCWNSNLTNKSGSMYRCVRLTVNEVYLWLSSKSYWSYCLGVQRINNRKTDFEMLYSSTWVIPMSLMDYLCVSSNFGVRKTKQQLW